MCVCVCVCVGVIVCVKGCGCDCVRAWGSLDGWCIFVWCGRGLIMCVGMDLCG